jgi:membrane protein DedA with SNARE-associated domain/rhodanese-related sulfurtransferase
MQQLASDIERYGPLLVLLAVLLAEGGLPLPALPLLITAGALAAQSPYQALVIILAGVGGCMLADLAWYCGSKRYGRRVLGLLCKMSMSPDFCVRQSEAVFLKIGPWSLLCTKFLPGLSTISVAMAGVTKMPLPTFLLLDGMGALLFVGVAVATGWMLQDAINSVVAVVVDVGRLGALLLVALLGLYLLARWWRRRAFIRRLRTDRIAVDDLVGLIKEGRKPLIFDVRPKEIRRQTGIIPGALPARPEDIDDLAKTYAHDLETVMYCACPNEASAAMAAKHLARAGFKKIRPLLGGIDAWVEAGQPLEPAPAPAIPTGRRARDHLAGALPVERKDPGDVPAH